MFWTNMKICRCFAAIGYPFTPFSLFFYISFFYSITFFPLEWKESNWTSYLYTLPDYPW